MEKMGQRIKSVRKKRGLTLERLGELLGTNKQTISKYERGIIINLPIKTLSNLAKALGTTVGYLIGEQENTYINININDLSADELKKFNVIKDSVFLMFGENLTLKQKNNFEDILLYYYIKSIKN